MQPSISDRGTDLTMFGKHTHVLNYTGRYVQLVGDNPANTTSGCIPIVSAYQKSMDTICNYYVLLLIHKAPYLEQCTTTLSDTIL